MKPSKKIAEIIHKISEIEKMKTKLQNEITIAREKCQHEWETKYVPICGPSIATQPRWVRECQKCLTKQSTEQYKRPDFDFRDCAPIWRL
jgi:hypothetical protein